MEVWGFMEMIHSRSYTYIIKNVYSDPSEVFDKIITDDTKIVSISSNDPLGVGPATSTFVELWGGEGRIPVYETGAVLDQAGSYVLTRNIPNNPDGPAITIDARRVTFTTEDILDVNNTYRALTFMANAVLMNL